jgi:Protein of unknown function (DUF2750)
MNETTTDQENHDRFVRDVKANGVVWGLQSDHGWAVCESEEYEDTEVYPFWSDEAEARVHCTDDWADYAPARLDLDLFIDTWLAGMNEDGVMVGTNWDADLSGLEVEPYDLAKELLGEEFQAEEDGD